MASPTDAGVRTSHMDKHEETPVTALLNAVAHGDRSAQDGLFEAIYSELHKIARSQMAGQGAGRTLQPTALLHEAYLKLFRQGSEGLS